MIGDAQFARAVVAAPGVDPGVVALDPDHKTTGELIVASALHAAKPAFGLMFAERLAEERAAGRLTIHSFCVAHTPPA